MKKLLSIAVAFTISAMLLAGCAAGGYKDGTYKAEAAEYNHGWKDYVVVEVVSGKATIKDFDSLNEAGGKKTQDTEYRAAMEPVSGTYPVKFFPEIIAEYTAKGSVDKMDSIAGATNSTDSFKTLVAAALANAKKGDATAAVVSTEAE